jgi:hypothetical protein
MKPPIPSGCDKTLHLQDGNEFDAALAATENPS